VQIYNREYFVFWIGLLLAILYLLIVCAPILEMFGLLTEHTQFLPLFLLPISAILIVVGLIFGFVLQKNKSQKGKG
jgi:hypothetical protein